MIKSLILNILVSMQASNLSSIFSLWQGIYSCNRKILLCIFFHPTFIGLFCIDSNYLLHYTGIYFLSNSGLKHKSMDIFLCKFKDFVEPSSMAHLKYPTLGCNYIIYKISDIHPLKHATYPNSRRRPLMNLVINSLLCKIHV